MLLCNISKGISRSEMTHLGAHVGMAYLVNTVSYAFYRKTIRLTTWESLAYAAFTTVVVGFAYKVIENNGNSFDAGPSLGKNLIGIGASTLTVVVFKIEW